MNISDITQEMISDASEVLSQFDNETEITWEDFEEIVGVDIHPGEIPKNSNEWRGYIHTRNILKDVVNAHTMELGKRDAFKLVPCNEGTNYNLKKVAGNALWDDVNTRGKKKIKSVTATYVARVQEVQDKVELRGKARLENKNVLRISRMAESTINKLVDLMDREDMMGMEGGVPESTLIGIAYEATEEPEHGSEADGG